MRVIYVCGRLRAATGWDVSRNIRAAEEIGFEVAKLGGMPLIPHANTAVFSGTLTDEFWLEGTMELLRRCDAVITVPNWPSSAGARAEVDEAKKLGLPVFHAVWQLADWLKPRIVIAGGVEPAA